MFLFAVLLCNSVTFILCTNNLKKYTLQYLAEQFSSGKMSFTDIRDLSEHLKILGYPNAFPLSALYTTFGGPNSFCVVADILQWLAECFEPGTTLLGGTNDSNERILFIRSAAEFFVTKASIKINPKKLYASSNVAATELLKITNLLMNAPTDINLTNDDDNSSEQYKSSLVRNDLDDKIDDLRRARELSSELTNAGATLYELLAKELLNKETRTLQATRSLELASVERSLKTAITIMNQKLQSSKLQLDTSRNEKISLKSKLERKTADLERLQQRLDALQKIRPAYLEEFERLEVDLKGLYDQYFIRVRTLDALRAQVNARIKTPSTIQISTPIITTNATNKLLNENSINFLPDGILIDSDDEDDGDSADDDDDDDDDIKNEDGDGLLKKSKQKMDKDHKIILDDNGLLKNHRPTESRLRIRTGIPRDRFVGSMTGNELGISAGIGDPSDLDSSLNDSGSDIDIPDDDDDDDDDDLHTEDDDNKLIAKLTESPKMTIGNASKGVKPDHHSDEDF